MTNQPTIKISEYYPEENYTVTETYIFNYTTNQWTLTSGHNTYEQTLTVQQLSDIINSNRIHNYLAYFHTEHLTHVPTHNCFISDTTGEVLLILTDYPTEADLPW